MSSKPPLSPTADDRAFAELVRKHFGGRAFFLAILQPGGEVYTAVHTHSEIETLQLTGGAALALIRIAKGEPADVVTPKPPKEPA